MKLSPAPTGALGVALLLTISCAGEPARDATGGAPGAGARAGEGGAGEGTDAAHVLARDACERECAQYRYMELTHASCEPGTRLYHNQVLGEAGAAGLPEGEAPRCDDEHWIDACVIDVFAGSFACWQEAVDIYDCMSEATWFCDEWGGWVNNSCGSPVEEICPP